MWKAIEVSPDIYWCGVIDWTDRRFEGHYIDRGSTYNSYLIMDEKITLIDPVEGKFADQNIDYIRSIVDPSKIDYIVSQHGELDHAQGLGRLLELAPNAKVVTGAGQGLKCLRACFGTDHDYVPVKTGDTINIGKRTLQFIHTPMVHWPDNMVTYCAEDKILFSNDCFGQHFTSSERFDYQNDLCTVLEEAKDYYANIVMPYSLQAANALKAVNKLDVSLILTGHGVIWKDHIDDIKKCYAEWTANDPGERAVVIYSTMYQSTYHMALAVVEAFTQLNIPVRLFDLAHCHNSEIMPAILDAKYLALGTSTHDRKMLADMASFVTFMTGLIPPKPNRKAFAFGSYGWSGEGAKDVNEILTQSGFDMICDPIVHEYTLTLEQMGQICDQAKEAIKKAQ